MATVFFYGSLRHEPLRTIVIGRDVPVEPARLPGFAAVITAGSAEPALVPGTGTAEGLVTHDLTEDELARLHYYVGGDDFTELAVYTVDGAQSVLAQINMRSGTAAAAQAPFDLSAWQEVWGQTATTAGADLMLGYGRTPPSVLRARYPQMLTRAGARVRAAADGPAALRERWAPDAVERIACRQPYAQYFAVEEYDLRFRRFDGRMSEALTRAVFISGDAAVVLPYDPVRDCVLVIEQFRAGPYARGAGNPWLIEAVAGRIDGGETPEAAARREAREEAGLDLRDLIPALQYYPSPAAKAEYLYTYVGIADLPDTAAGLGGLDGEGEDIRAHVIPFDRLMALVDSGEADNAPLILLALWLARHRDRLRQTAGT